MPKKVLLMGCTGKMGTALTDILSQDFNLRGTSSRDLDAADLEQVRKLVQAENADIVINTVAFLGIDPCAREPEKAFKLNCLLPLCLSQLSRRLGFVLVQFSTDGVFNDEKGDFYVESDPARPLHIYGMTKYSGDCLVQATAQRYYLVRIPVLFGESARANQFVEKMLSLIEQGKDVLRIADDVISSPSYSRDIARRIKQLLMENAPFGLYHVANAGKASLFELMQEIVAGLSLKVNIERASYRDFPYVGRKNLYTPIRSEKISSLRPWQEAVAEYCLNLRHNRR